MDTLILSDVLTDDYLKRLDLLKLQMQSKNTIKHSGLRKSKAVGKSSEFHDYKNYSLGDDIKFVDWNLYARSDRLYVKTFLDERQTRVNVFLDMSKSMDYGEKNKFFFGKWLASSLAYISLNNFDSFSIYSYHNKIVNSMENITSINRFQNIVKYMEDLKSDKTTDINNVLNDTLSHNINNSICIFISDFLYENNYFDALKSLRARNNDIKLIQILSEEEIQPELYGNIRLVDIETDEKKEITINTDVVSEYKNNLRFLQDGIQAFCDRLDISFIKTASDKNPLSVLLKLV